MEFSDVAKVTIGKFTGECDIYFDAADCRFRIVRKPSSSGKGVVVGMMFGMLGQAIMNNVNEGEEMASFTPADIREVEAVEKKHKSILTIYPYSGDGPYVITIGNKKNLCAYLHRELMENRYNAAAPAAPQAPMMRTEVPPMLLQDTPPVQPMEPVAPIQPVAPVPPMQPQVPMQPAPMTSVPPMQPQMPMQPAPMPSVPPMPPAAPVPPAPPASPMTGVPVQHSVRQPIQPPVQQPAQPAAPGGNALLCLRSGALAGRVYPVPMGAVLVIGRSPARSNLALPQYEKVSGAHCRVEIGNRCLRVSDLNSTNGTFANGAPVQPNQPVILREGDTLMLGNEACVFRIAFE